MNLSIVIPAYNVEDYIEEAVESVLSQTVSPMEVIIIDDGSTDRTREALSRYKNNDLIKIFRTNNNGLGAARNLGLRQAAGEYVYFFDSDDILDNKFVETMCGCVGDYSFPDMVFFSGESFSESGMDLRAFPLYKRKINYFFGGGAEVVSALVSCSSFFSSACLYISKRSFLLKNEFFFKEILHEDAEIIFRQSVRAESALVVDKTLFFRRIRAQSIMTRARSEDNFRGYEQALLSMLSFRKEEPALYRSVKRAWKVKFREIFFVSLSIRREVGVRYHSSLFRKSLIAVLSPSLLSWVYGFLLSRFCGKLCGRRENLR